MNIEHITQNGVDIAVISGPEKLITSTSPALELSVETPLPVQQVALHRHAPVCIHCGPHPHVGHRGRRYRQLHPHPRAAGAGGRGDGCPVPGPALRHHRPGTPRQGPGLLPAGRAHGQSGPGRASADPSWPATSHRASQRRTSHVTKSSQGMVIISRSKGATITSAPGHRAAAAACRSSAVVSRGTGTPVTYSRGGPVFLLG